VFDELLLTITFQPKESVHRDVERVGSTSNGALQTYLNNHLKLTIFYHSERGMQGSTNVTAVDVCRIVAFEVYPQRCETSVINFKKKPKSLKSFPSHKGP